MYHARTPLKSMPSNSSAKSMLREGDWICCRCKNLNFAFRKRCNRCKIRIGEEAPQSASIRYPYPPQYQEPLQCLWAPAAFSNITNLGFRTSGPKTRYKVVTPQKSRREDPEKDEELQTKKKLPSVSPLVKKYRKNFREDRTWPGDCETSNFAASSLCWNSDWINKDETENMASSKGNYPSRDLPVHQCEIDNEAEIDDQIAQMVKKIII